MRPFYREVKTKVYPANGVDGYVLDLRCGVVFDVEHAGVRIRDTGNTRRDLVRRLVARTIPWRINSTSHDDRAALRPNESVAVRPRDVNDAVCVLPSRKRQRQRNVGARHIRPRATQSKQVTTSSDHAKR